MNIYAKKGQRVMYLADPRLGGDYDQQKAAEHLTPRAVYTVHVTDVASWSTTVYLQEFPGVGFNSVMFGDEDGTPDPENELLGKTIGRDGIFNEDGTPFVPSRPLFARPEEG